MIILFYGPRATRAESPTEGQDTSAYHGARSTSLNSAAGAFDQKPRHTITPMSVRETGHVCKGFVVMCAARADWIKCDKLILHPYQSKPPARPFTWRVPGDKLRPGQGWLRKKKGPVPTCVPEEMDRARNHLCSFQVVSKP